MVPHETYKTEESFERQTMNNTQENLTGIPLNQLFMNNDFQDRDCLLMLVNHQEMKDRDVCLSTGQSPVKRLRKPSDQSS